MDKVESLERMVLFNSAIKMNSAVFAGVAQDRGFVVYDGELVAVGCDFEVLNGDDGNHGEEGPGWLPTLRTAAGVVV